MREQVLEVWLKRQGAWVLFRNVPGRACDECGFETYAQPVAEVLATALSGDSRDLQAVTLTVAMIDFADLEPERRRGKVKAAP